MSATATSSRTQFSSQEEVLLALRDGRIDMAECVKALEQFKPKSVQRVTLKVSDKGGISVYGMNAKWPVTLYPEQWERLLAMADEIRSFAKANESELRTKGAASKAAKAAAAKAA